MKGPKCTSKKRLVGIILYTRFANPLTDPYPLLVHPTQVNFKGEQVNLKEKVDPFFYTWLANPLADPYPLLVQHTVLKWIVKGTQCTSKKRLVPYFVHMVR
jgi:hypothetical protein